MSNVVLAVRVWATEVAAETANASSRNAIFLRMRGLRGILPEISERAFCSTHGTFLLPSTQYMYQPSEPQQDQGADDSFYASDGSHFLGQVPVSCAVSMAHRNTYSSSSCGSLRG